MTLAKNHTAGNGEKPSITWHSLSTEETLKVLDVHLDVGLTTDEAARRLEKYGPNQLEEGKRRTFLKMLFDQLKSFVVLLLIAASIISAILNEWVDAGAIVLIVVLNAILGIVQESRAEAALAALKKMAAPEAQVERDDHRISIPARDLVPGDVVYLEAGNFVPADLRLMEAINLRVEEAALTGESVAVEKTAAVTLDRDIPLGDRKNTAFMGTVISYGRGKGLVTSTGMHTQLGMIAKMLQAVEDEETPLQRKLEQLGKTLGWAALVICAIIFGAGLLQGGSALEMFMVAVSLAIAAVPEGLPAIVTISLALGMREMIHRHALIRKLSSVETLGSATVICSDKTGTLTQNEMTVTRVWVDGEFIEISGTGYRPEGEFRMNGKPISLKDFPAVATALWVGVLNNDAELEKMTAEDGSISYRIIGDPTEGSIVVAAAKAGAMLEQLNEAYPREKEIPFDSVRKRMITMHRIQKPKSEDISPFYDDKRREWYAIAVKGAPDIVLDLCNAYQSMNDKETKPLDKTSRQQILDANDVLTRSALRVLGMAYRIIPALPDEIKSNDLEKDLIFAGLIGMIDPARKEVQPAMQIAREAGIRTIMITGDYPNTARAIAEDIGLLQKEHRVITGMELNEMSDDQLTAEIHDIDVFARVSPEHKMRIVDALRANNEIVAMTGDGVNDAPAIKRADIGVAMGITGTDVAKETADMVLTDDNYASIVSAVEQGRIIYSNIRKFVYYLVSCNMAEIMTIFIPTVLGFGSPLAPIQLLWLNLVTDGAPALALGTEKGDPDIMQQKPRPAKEPIINRYMLVGVVIQTIAITSATLIAFFVGLGHNLLYAETMAFATLSISELFRAYTARSERYPLLKTGIFGNKWMNIAVAVSLVLVLAVIYVPFLNPVFNTVPLNWTEWELILPLMLIPSLAAEAVKYFVTSRQKHA